MSKYFCPICAVDCDEPICKYCNNPAESLEVDLDKSGVDEKYTRGDLADANVDQEELSDDLVVEEIDEKKLDDDQDN